MERKYSVTGFCPKANKDIKVSATYVFNTNVSGLAGLNGCPVTLLSCNTVVISFIKC